MLNAETVRAAVMQMITTSGFLDAAGLTPSDADIRLNIDYEHAAMTTFDMSDCLEHADVLVDYARLYGPAIHGMDVAAQLDESGTTMILAMTPRLATETASDDEFDGAFDDDIEDDDEEEYDEDGDDEDYEEDEGEDGEPAPDGSATSRLSERNRLKVLTTAEMHKMAGKIYSVLGDSADMAQYANFLHELDNLLEGYGGLPAMPREGLPASPDKPEEIEAAMLIAELAAVFISEETAKKKKKGGHKPGRSGLLSVIMKALAGDAGEKVQSAWDKIDVDGFKAAFSQVLDHAVSTLAQFAEDKGDGGEKPATDDKTVNDNPIKFKTEKASVTIKAHKGMVIMADRIAIGPNAEVAALTPEDAPEQPAPIIVMMPLLNGQDIIDWASEQGISRTMLPEDMHVTVAYSKQAVDWKAVPPATESIQLGASNERTVGFLGDQGAFVLHIGEEEAAPLAERWQRYRDNGASWDFDSYLPHITITWESGLSEDDLRNIEPYKGPLLFGGEVQNTMSEGGFDVNTIQHVDTE